MMTSRQQGHAFVDADDMITLTSDRQVLERLADLLVAGVEDIDLVINDPEGPDYYSCCGKNVRVSYGIMDHAKNCKQVAARNLLAEHDPEMYGHLKDE